MDAYACYNQIFMHPIDSEYMTFIIDKGLYCYNVMLPINAPFFKALKGSKQYITWMAECDLAFQELKDYMSNSPLLLKPLPE
ncbi:unnamed protein product, partial [Prunus brigantina]